MLKSYLTTTWRHIIRHKSFSTINILGLALGMGCSLMILLWVNDERAIDRFHSNDANLYALYETQLHDGKVDAGYNTPGVLADELKTVFPEVQYAIGMGWTDERTFEGNHKILKQKGTYAGADFFRMFDYTLLKGSPETALATPADIAISRKMAVTFFGSPDAAIGQTLRFENKDDKRVSAVFEDVTAQSSRQFDYMLNWETFLRENEWARDWGNHGPDTYIALHPGTDVAAFEAKLSNFLDRFKPDKNFVIRLHLQRYSDVYLHGTFKDGQLAGGRIQYVTLFSVVAVFILLIACINFMNLTTARSVKRAREIGVRKVVGAVRMALVRQFIGEALVIVCVAFGGALLFVALLLPAFNSAMQKHVQLPLPSLTFWLYALGLIFITGVVSGSYPALYLSGFNPVKAFRGSFKFGGGALWFRKSLVVFQFTLSIVLVIGTLVVSQQVRFIQRMNLGYDRDNLVYLPIEGELTGWFDVFRHKAAALDGIQLVSKISQTPSALYNGTGGVVWEGKDPNVMLQFTFATVGYDFARTMNVPFAAGRDFSRDFASDSAAYIINETAVGIIGYKDPVGMSITMWGRPGKIIGVVKDFHFTEVKLAMRPLILQLNDNFRTGWILVRTEASKTKEAIAGLERVWKSLNPQFPFTYQFADDEFQKLYTSEAQIEKLSNAFAFLAIFISCLGLLGLAMFTTEQRTREIGIRKVLGASLSSLFGLLSRELLILVGASLVVATPLAWYLASDWLKEYAYRVELGWPIFVVAGVLAIAIALATISMQTVKALMRNPVSSLKVD